MDPGACDRTDHHSRCAPAETSKTTLAKGSAMFAFVLGATVLVVLVLATVFGLTADSRQPGHWYPGERDRDPGDDTLTRNGRLA
jgi:hypothetical protein